jgi:hypothetical protein
MKPLILFVLFAIGLIPSNNNNSCQVKSNAEIISFDARKCMCCWGWVIKMGKDTIKSADDRIYKLVGYEIKEPVKVYVELGEHKFYRYYSIKKIILAE